MNETSLALNAALGMNHNPTSHLNTNTTSSSSNNAVGGPSSHLPSHLPSTSSSSGPSSSILPSSTSMNMAGPSSRDPGLGSSSTSNSAIASGSGSGSGPGPSGMALGIPTGMNNQQQQLLNAAAQRKQNIACDGCRSRKVKCVRQPGSERVSAKIPRRLVVVPYPGSWLILSRRPLLVRPLSSEKDVVHITLRHLPLHSPTETHLLAREWEWEWDREWRWRWRFGDDEFR